MYCQPIDFIKVYDVIENQGNHIVILIQSDEHDGILRLDVMDGGQPDLWIYAFNIYELWSVFPYITVGHPKSVRFPEMLQVLFFFLGSNVNDDLVLLINVFPYVPDDSKLF